MPDENNVETVVHRNVRLNWKDSGDVKTSYATDIIVSTAPGGYQFTILFGEVSLPANVLTVVPESLDINVVARIVIPLDKADEITRILRETWLKFSATHPRFASISNKDTRDSNDE